MLVGLNNRICDRTSFIFPSVLLQCMEHAMSCLEEQQDEFDFKYQTFNMEGKQTGRFWLFWRPMIVFSDE